MGGGAMQEADPAVRPNPVIAAVDAYVDLGNAKGYAVAEMILMRFLPEERAAWGSVREIRPEDLTAFTAACRARAGAG